MGISTNSFRHKAAREGGFLNAQLRIEKVANCSKGGVYRLRFGWINGLEVVV